MIPRLGFHIIMFNVLLQLLFGSTSITPFLSRYCTFSICEKLTPTGPLNFAKWRKQTTVAERGIIQRVILVLYSLTRVYTKFIFIYITEYFKNDESVQGNEHTRKWSQEQKGPP
jgi:hypothetical protein